MNSSLNAISSLASQSGCDITGSTPHDDLIVVTHHRIPIGYLLRDGKRFIEISEKDFIKRSNHHADIERIKVSLKSKNAFFALGFNGISRADIFENLLQLTALCLHSQTLLMLFLLCLAAPFMSQLYPLFGNGLIVSLPDIQTAPLVLQVLMTAFGGPSEWEHKEWKACIPHIWHAYCHLGDIRPSSNLRDYAPLDIEFHKYSVRLSSPIVNRIITLESSVPQGLTKQLCTQYPYAVPLLLGRKTSIDGRIMLILSGSELQQYDPEILTMLQKFPGSFQRVMSDFAKHCSSSLQSLDMDIQENARRFLPHTPGGKYVCENTDEEQKIKAILLALLSEFIHWGIARGYCSRESGDTFFSAVWGEILPESSPKPPVDTAAKPEPESAHSFLLFLAEYLNEHIDGICTPGEAWCKQSVARLHTLQHQTQCLLICSRTELIGAYSQWLHEHNVDFTAASEPALQKALTQDGIPFRSERRDTTWRFALYPSEKSIPCLAVPVMDLLTLFRNHEIDFGSKLEQLLSSDTAADTVETIPVTEFNDFAEESDK